MKQQYCLKLSIILGLTLLSFTSLAAQTIYGLTQAKQFNSATDTSFYIQLGTYKNKANALQAKSHAQEQSNYPVLLREKSGYYLILLGPFRSATEVRAAAQALGTTSPVASRTRYVTPNVVALQPVVPAKAPVSQDKDGVLPPNHWLIGVGGGWIAPFNTNATNFASSGIPDFPDDRYVNRSVGNTGQISVYLGYQWQRGMRWIPAYSVNFEHVYNFPTRIKGVIFVNDLPDAENFAYQYDISQQATMAKVKLDLYQWQRVMPYISGGIGVTQNFVTKYSDKPIPGATVMNRRFSFSSTNMLQLTGSLGMGFDYRLSSNSEISVGYELAFYGKTRTGYGDGSLSGDLLTNKVNSNGIVVKGTYFFD